MKGKLLFLFQIVLAYLIIYWFASDRYYYSIITGILCLVYSILIIYKKEALFRRPLISATLSEQYLRQVQIVSAAVFFIISIAMFLNYFKSGLYRALFIAFLFGVAGLTHCIIWIIKRKKEILLDERTRLILMFILSIIFLGGAIFVLSKNIYFNFTKNDSYALMVAMTIGSALGFLTRKHFSRT